MKNLKKNQLIFFINTLSDIVRVIKINFILLTLFTLLLVKT